jgi:hypothetical protein
MRASRFTDHKLLLQDFARTSRGTALFQRVAAVLGTSPSSVLAMIDDLPQMDFYVPFRGQRMAWSGSAEVVVAATFDSHAPTLNAYAVDGSLRTLQLSDGEPAQTLVILHPAEPKGILSSNEPQGADGAIESPKESGVTVFSVCGAACDPGDPGGGGGTGPAPGLYVTQFYSYRDDGWGG